MSQATAILSQVKNFNSSEANPTIVDEVIVKFEGDDARSGR